jgi:PAS domain S-box-containing protein
VHSGVSSGENVTSGYRCPLRRLGTSRLSGFFFISLAACLLLQFAVSAEAKPVRRVLVLSEAGTTYLLINLVDEGIRTALVRSPYRIEFYRGYMDTAPFPDSADQQVLVDRYINHGEVSGDISSAMAGGKIVSGMMPRLLNGESPEDTPLVKSAVKYVFDWRVLKRWRPKEEDGPSGSIVVNRELDFWESHKLYVVSLLLVLLAQTVAIVLLLWHRARRRKAEAQLRRSEERFAKLFRRSPLMITVSRMKDGQYVDVNEAFEEQTGWTRDELIGRTLTYRDLWVDPSRRFLWQKQLLATGNIRGFETKLRRKDGQIRTVLVSAEVIEINGEQCILSVKTDISERKMAEEAISSVSRKLIEAQEEERTRIARELHDDIGQQMSILCINLETVRANLPSSDVAARNRVDEVIGSASDLVTDVHELSHRLHSSKLQYLGLEAACASFCKELSEQQKVKIDFHAYGIPNTLSSEVSLCLFRILQEALHNAVKHSGVREFEVRLVGTSDEINLIVRDFGRGFDFGVASCGEGLGVVSMRERLKSVNGHLSIDSKSGHGTTVMARVPLQVPKTALSILLVDDFQPWREELRPILERESPLQIVGEATSGREAIEKAKELRPDIVLLDLGLPDLNGVQVARRINEDCPGSKIIVVSSHDDADLANQIADGVVQGYLLKSECRTELAFAISSVVAGERHISKRLRAI